MTDSYFIFGVAFPPSNDVTSGKSCNLWHTLQILKGISQQYNRLDWSLRDINSVNGLTQHIKICITINCIVCQRE